MISAVSTTKAPKTYSSLVLLQSAAEQAAGLESPGDNRGSTVDLRAAALGSETYEGDDAADEEEHHAPGEVAKTVGVGDPSPGLPEDPIQKEKEAVMDRGVDGEDSLQDRDPDASREVAEAKVSLRLAPRLLLRRHSGVCSHC